MNRKKSIYSLFLLAAVLLLPAAVQAADLAPQHTVAVTGHAEASIAPDIAIASFGVQTLDSDVESAKRENDRIMQKVYEALLVAGVDRSKLQTSVFSVQPVYKPDNSDTVSGYRVQNMLHVTIEDMRNVSQVIDTALNAGANQFQGIRFSVKREQSLRDELLRQALLDGKRKASLIAETLGESLGRPASVIESGHFTPMMMDGARMASFKSSSSTLISSGTITASVDVQMVFELR